MKATDPAANPSEWPDRRRNGPSTLGAQSSVPFRKADGVLAVIVAAVRPEGLAVNETQ